MRKFLSVYLIGIFSFIVLLSGCSISTVSKKESRDKHWRVNIEHLARKLPQKHAGLFFDKTFNETKEEFKKELDYLTENVSDLSDEEIKIAMMKAIASIGDSHTTINFDFKDIFLLESYVFKDGLYIINGPKEYEDIIYKKIVKVNNINIEEVIEKLSEIIPHENEAKVELSVPSFLQYPEILYGLKIISEKNSMELVLEDENGKLSNKIISAIKYKDIENYDLVMKYDNEEKIPLYKRHATEYYWYKHLKSSKTIYLKYNRCKNMGSKSFSEFSKEVFDVIDNNDVNKLVIDLRLNGGGSGYIFDEIIDEIKKRKKINKKDSLFVIVGRKTFSAAIINAVELKNKTNAVFLGEPTSGKPNHYGQKKSFQLPYNKIKVTYSTRYFDYSNEDSLSFMPDKIVEPTIDDFKNGVDPVLDELLGK